MKTLLTTLLFGAVLSAQNYYEYKAKEDNSLNGFEVTKEVYNEIMQTFYKPMNSITQIETESEYLYIAKKVNYITIKQQYKGSGEIFTTQPIKLEQWIGLDLTKN